MPRRKSRESKNENTQLMSSPEQSQVDSREETPYTTGDTEDVEYKTREETLMSEGLFGQLNVDEIPDDPFAMPDNDYKGYVQKAEVRTPKKAGSIPNLVLTYQVTEGDYEGFTAQEWYPIPEAMNDNEQKRQLSFLKARLKSLGVPESRMNQIVPNELEGERIVFTIKNNEGTGEHEGKTFKNVVKVVLQD